MRDSQVESVECLLELRADAGAKALTGGTPLHMAALGGHSGTIQVSLELCEALLVDCLSTPIF
jgi:ankyrin repeat protein